MERDSSSDPPSRIPDTSINDAARMMARASAKAIRGTPAAKKRASTAGRYSWSTRLKGAFEAGYEFGHKNDLDVERAWRIWVVTNHGGLARLFGWAAWIIAGFILIGGILIVGEKREPTHTVLSNYFIEKALRLEDNAIEKSLGLPDHSIEVSFQPRPTPTRIHGPAFVK